MKHFICNSLLVVLFSVNASSQNPILPQPQKLTYSKEKLAIKGLTIRFASKPSVEDRFAAKELSKILSKITSLPIPVKEKSSYRSFYNF